jgi:hypothetical protein
LQIHIFLTNISSSWQTDKTNLKCFTRNLLLLHSLQSTRFYLQYKHD